MMCYGALKSNIDRSQRQTAVNIAFQRSKHNASRMQI
jgi:hypothetical protein